MPSLDSPTLPRWTVGSIPIASSGLFNSAREHEPKDSVNEVDEANDTLTTVRQTLDRLRRWQKWGVRRQKSPRWYLLSLLYPRRPPCPSPLELRRLALFFFPPRAIGVQVEICDYGEGRFERRAITIDQLGPRESTSITRRLNHTKNNRS